LAKLEKWRAVDSRNPRDLEHNVDSDIGCEIAESPDGWNVVDKTILTDSFNSDEKTS
jgi:hypothetical protein